MHTCNFIALSKFVELKFSAAFALANDTAKQNNFPRQAPGPKSPEGTDIMKQNSRARALLSSLSLSCLLEWHVRECAAAENLRNELIRTLGIIIAHQLFTRLAKFQLHYIRESLAGETGPCSRRRELRWGASDRKMQVPKSGRRCGCGCCTYIYIFARILQRFSAGCESKHWALLCLLRAHEGWANLAAINSVEVRFSIKKSEAPL